MPAPPSATQPHIPPDERGDELDWLNNPAGGGPEWSGSTVAPQTAPSRAPAGNWRVAQSGPEYQPATAGAHSRKQFVFSRLPLWLRAPSAGLPSMDRNRWPQTAQRLVHVQSPALSSNEGEELGTHAHHH